ncbi:zinc-ribbon domain-containing protein [Streptomyces sp. NPDC003032]
MASYCPHCGAPAPDEARFCMKCGKERLPEPPAPEAPPTPTKAPEPAVPATDNSSDTAATPPPPASPPPPTYTPTPAPTAPFAVGAFFGRAFRGDWAGAAQAALWPIALLLIGAIGIAIPAYGQDDEVVVDFTDRLRISLALLLQSVGGGFELTGSEQRPGFGESESNGMGPGGLGSDASGSALEGAASLHLVPLTVTALWIAALFIGVRVLRNRLIARGHGHLGGHQGGGTAGLEAALRVALLVTAGVLVLALFAQPEIEGIELSSSPALAALGALVLALVVSCGVLHRDGPAVARPGAQAAVRVVGTALRALVVVLVLCSVVAFISLAQVDDLKEITDLDDDGVSPLLVALLILPNLAVAALGIGWGAAAETSVRGSSSRYGGGYESESFGLSELGDVTNDWAVVGALALGLVCALTIGVLAARRCVGRGEQLLSAAVFFGLILLLAGVGGFGVEASGAVTGGSSGFGGAGGDGSVEAGLSVPEVLLFGLLWIFAATLLGPYLLRMTGQSDAPAAPAYAPGVPPLTAAPAGTPTDSAPTGATPAGAVPADSALTGAAPAGVVPAGSAPTGAAPAGAVPADSALTGAAPAGVVPAGSAPTGATPADSVPTGANPAAPTSAGATPPGAASTGTTPEEAAAYVTQSAPGAPPPGAPIASGTPPTGTPTPAYIPNPHHPDHPVHPLHAVHLGPQPPAATKPRGRVGVWVGTLAGAFLIGGGATAGILVWQDSGDDKADNAGRDDKPSVSRSEEPSRQPNQEPNQEPSQEPGPATSQDTDSTDPGTAEEAEVPKGSERVTDSEGFSFAVPEGWTRQSVDPERPGQITYAGSTGREEFLVGVVTAAPYTSYENFANIEKHTKSAPDKSDYDRIRMEENTFQGRDGAIWEYTYTDEAGRTIHAINQSYVAENGTEYAIQLSWREDFWPVGEGAKTHRTALETWRLTD